MSVSQFLSYKSSKINGKLRKDKNIFARQSEVAKRLGTCFFSMVCCFTLCFSRDLIANGDFYCFSDSEMSLSCLLLCDREWYFEY